MLCLYIGLVRHISIKLAQMNVPRANIFRRVAENLLTDFKVFSGTKPRVVCSVEHIKNHVKFDTVHQTWTVRLDLQYNKLAFID